MASFLQPKLPVQQQQQQQQQQIQQQQKQILTPELIQQIRRKLDEMGPGPFTPEQQNKRESYIRYLNLEIQANQNNQQIQQQQIQQQQHVQQIQQQQQQQQQLQQQQQQHQQQQIQQASSNDQSNNVNSSQITSQILDKRALQDLVKEVDPTEQLDEDVEDLLLQVADDFIENVINTSCQLAKHRKSNTLEVKDVQFHLERNFNLWIPGFSSDELKPFKKSFATEAHKQRLQLIKKTSTSKPAETNSKNKE